MNEQSQLVGSCVERGGAVNLPAAVCDVEKVVDWLEKYAPPTAAGMTFSEAGPIPAQGNIAQEVLDALCPSQENVTARLERSAVQGDLGPKFNEERDAEYWLEQQGAPAPKLESEDEEPQTTACNELIKSRNN